MRRSRSLICVLTAVVLTIAMAACSTPPQPTRSATPSAAEPTAAVPHATPTPSPSPTSTKALARKDPSVWIGRYPIEIPVDNGPERYAMGTVTTDGDGVPVAYKVARGDIIDYIAERFGFWVGLNEPGFDYLNTINQVRRGTVVGGSDENFALYAGDTLNLSPYTVTTVGDENGRVIPGPLPTPLPPQR